MESSLYRFWLSVLFTIPVIYLEIVSGGTITLVPTQPSTENAYTGDTARLVFNYTATDRDGDFESFSPTWNAYPNGILTKLMHDDFYATPPWNWTEAPTCPDRYKTRISREGIATLVIRNVTKEDTGNYSCIIPRRVGGTSPASYIFLYVSDRPTSQPITQAPNMTDSPQGATTTQAPPGLDSTPAPSTGLGSGAIAGIVVGCLVVVAIVVGVIWWKKRP